VIEEKIGSVAKQKYMYFFLLSLVNYFLYICSLRNKAI
jgi:hypothetical protein